VIHLLPPVCRDCGKGADEVNLSPYLDFRLCGACIARREREVRTLDNRNAARPSRAVPRRARPSNPSRGGPPKKKPNPRKKRNQKKRR
jgi:hypothetical protein